MHTFELATSLATWLVSVGALLTGLAAITALGLVGWSEKSKLISQHRHDERRKLQELIGRYHGRLLEAAIDWDRRMHQLYERKVEVYLDDPAHRGRPETYIHGKFLDQKEYLFRSYVFRFLALCGLARRFEREAFYINAKVARRSDFQFLKYTKAMIWAATNSDLHDDVVPSKDHFPNDEFRPILDACYQDASAAENGNGSVPVFDLARLEALVAEDHNAHLQGCERKPPIEPGAVEGVEAEGAGVVVETEPKTFPPARGVGRVVLFFIGLRKGNEEEGRPRYNWDRLCVLHLLVMAFINEFGYPWQRRSDVDFQQAVNAIDHPAVCAEFDRAIPSLGLLDGRRRIDELKAAVIPSGEIENAPMSYVHELVNRRASG